MPVFRKCRFATWKAFDPRFRDPNIEKRNSKSQKKNPNFQKRMLKLAEEEPGWGGGARLRLRAPRFRRAFSLASPGNFSTSQRDQPKSGGLPTTTVRISRFFFPKLENRQNLCFKGEEAMLVGFGNSASRFHRGGCMVFTERCDGSVISIHPPLWNREPNLMFPQKHWESKGFPYVSHPQ